MVLVWNHQIRSALPTEEAVWGSGRPSHSQEGRCQEWKQQKGENVQAKPAVCGLRQASLGIRAHMQRFAVQEWHMRLSISCVLPSPVDAGDRREPGSNSVR
jgi:hypothetical protein